MAFDGRPEDWRDGPRCKGCNEPILEEQPTTEMHFIHDPDGELGMTGTWHGECARPYWDTLTPVLDQLRRQGF